MNKAVSYLRWSTPEQCFGDSERRQAELTQRWLDKHPEVKLDENLKFKDEGVSSYRAKNFHAGKLRELADLVRKGTLGMGDFILVERIDRISRALPYSAQKIMQF